jgi:hypothetical protein
MSVGGWGGVGGRCWRRGGFLWGCGVGFLMLMYGRRVGFVVLPMMDVLVFLVEDHCEIVSRKLYDCVGLVLLILTFVVRDRQYGH